jgi:hypothetical protein
VAWRRKETKVNDACCALYITALVAGVLELETTVLHVSDPTVRCICTPIMLCSLFCNWLQNNILQ